MKLVIVVFFALLILTEYSYAQKILSEAEVAHVLRTVNDAEIDAAKLAQRKANNTHVKGYADLMETAHLQNNDDHKAMIKEAQIKPENNNISRVLKKDSKNKIKQLKQYSDTKIFDKIYVEHQVVMHRQLLDDLDLKYIPNQNDARFKAYLEKTRELVQSHYQLATELQARITK